MLIRSIKLLDILTIYATGKLYQIYLIMALLLTSSRISETFEKLMNYNPNEQDNYVLRLFMGVDQWKSSIDVTNSQFQELEK